MRTPFEQIVHDHAATVLRVCRAALGSGPDADDAWSETFLAALRAWPALEEEANVQAWLVRIAQRKIVDAIRARQRRPAPVEHLPDHGYGSADDPVADDIWMRVAELPQQQRLAIAYHYFGGLAHTETAELIGSTPAAVRRAAADGIRKLRSALIEPTMHKESTHDC